MKNMVLIGEVATLAREIENAKDSFRVRLATDLSVSSNAWNPNKIQDIMNQEADEHNGKKEIAVEIGVADAATAFMANRKSAQSNQGKDAPSVASIRSLESAATADPEFTLSQQMEMATLLDAWEDPITQEEQEVRCSPLAGIISILENSPLLPSHAGKESYHRSCLAVSPSLDLHEEKISFYARYEAHSGS